MQNLITVREAKPEDIKAIHKLLAIYAAKQVVLPRSEEDILHYINNFVVAIFDGHLRGCVAVRDFGNDLLEVRSLVVEPGYQGKGIGRAMVEAIIAGHKCRERFRLFALTYQEEFFKSLGFRRVSVEMFPEKVWSDCVNCPKKNCCDEIAVILEYGMPYGDAPAK